MIQSSTATADFANPRHDRWVGLLLALITLALYWPARQFEFNNYDDAQYITQNPHVLSGLTAQNLTWAFTGGYASNWHPLTWLSHQLDCAMYGVNAGGHHLTNIIFHVANTVLLFAFLRRWTGALWRSAFVAALFGWHPAHVESVAWVAERKDVLSSFFWMLTLLAYYKYKVQGLRHQVYYGLSLLCFALGLLCKPMVVSLPLVLLLLDYWHTEPGKEIARAGKNWPQLILEKIPFFVLSAASCVITIVAQKHGSSVQSLAELPLRERLANALVSYTGYLGKLFWPVNLAVIYPYQHHLPLIKVLAAAALLVGITLLVCGRARSHPHLLVGWFWFGITLVPVIGLVQVGEQAMADRYTYLPAIGVFVMLAWEAPGTKRFAGVVGTVAGLVLIGCLVTASLQLRYWRNSVTLFTRAVQVTKDNVVANCNLATALIAEGKTNEALGLLEKALQINPNHTESLNNMGFLLAGEGKLEDAKTYLETALKLRPNYDSAQYNLGVVLLKQDKLDDAITHLRSATRINPDYDKALTDLGMALAREGNLDEAITQYRAALRIAPNNAYAHLALGRAMEARNQPNDAAAQYAAAVEIQPDMAEARDSLGALLAAHGKFKEAQEQFEAALKIHPNAADIHYDFAGALVAQGKLAEAAAQWTEAIRLQPDYPEAHFNLALVLTQLGQSSNAIAHFREALRLNPRSVPTMERLAWILATDSDGQLRDGAEALRLATQAAKLTDPPDASLLDVRAAALAETGHFPEAALAAGKAMELATAANQKELADKIKTRLDLYQSGKPFHEAASGLK